MAVAGRMELRPGAAVTAGYELALLPRFELAYEGRPVDVSLRSQRVLAFLAVERARVGRSHLAGTLWPDGTEERASASLRSALWMLPHGLPGIVIASGQNVELSPEVRVDYHAALDLGTRLAGGAQVAGGQPGGDALDDRLFASDLLAEWSEDWLMIEQERFRQVRLHALETICDRFIAAGTTAQAIQIALTAIAAEPLRESSHRALVRAHIAEGNLSEALRHSERFERLMEGELGIEPSPEFRRLTAEIVDGGSRAVPSVRPNPFNGGAGSAWVTAR
jgi:DNA-binding SARP family transcriptional activator